MAMKVLRKTGLYGKLMLLAVIMLIALAVQPVFASNNDFVTKRFDVDINVKENHLIHVKEKITVDFNQSKHHGITRFIPYKSKFYTIHDINSNFENDIETEESEDSKGESYKIMSIRLGSEDELLQGVQTFELSYTLKAYKDDDKKFDYFSQNVFPTAWVTGVENSKITINFPKKVDFSKARFYSGSFGSADSMKNIFSKKLDESGKRIVMTGKNIPAKYGATVNIKLPEGYWVNPADRSGNRWFLYLFLVMTPVILALMWVLFGRDPKLVKTVEFYPPENMTPAEIGYIIDGAVDRKDISTMIFYFASKGYLKIKEDDKENISLIKLKDISQEEKNFSQTLFNGIFSKSDVVNVDSFPESFAEDLITAEEQVKGTVDYPEGETRRLFTIKSKVARISGLILTAICGVSAILFIQIEAMGESDFMYMIVEFILQILGLETVMKAFDYMDSAEKSKTTLKYIIGIAAIGASAILPGMVGYRLLGTLRIFPLSLVSFVVSDIFVVLMKARTRESAFIQGRILGFKNFIKTAEYNKLKVLSEENPEYFFNIIPYAHVMGMASVWAKKFNNLHIPAPEWYEGSAYNPITPIWYYSMMGRFDDRISDQYANLISDSDDIDIGGFGGGGFGGGGFSGGGFGGGGGGAW